MNRSPKGPESILEAFLHHKQALQRFVARYLKGAPHDIEDIVQEVFVRSYSAELTTRIHSPRSFLFQTARNLALNHINQQKFRATGSLEELSADHLLPEGLVDERSPERHNLHYQQFVLFCRATERLPLQCRRAFILRKVYGLSHKAIAEELNISVSTVEKHLIAGFARCRQYLDLLEQGKPLPQPRGRSHRHE